MGSSMYNNKNRGQRSKNRVVIFTWQLLWTKSCDRYLRGRIFNPHNLKHSHNIETVILHRETKAQISQVTYLQSPR